MPGDYFWHCVEALAAAFDGESIEVEETLDTYEQRLKSFSPETRGRIRRQMVSIIGCLARLESRMAEGDKRKP